ncbi:hypothetical protein [Parasitella parasitica]|uniref:Uncharacterized protein n=1 Tax=Parasitella parasitica TaxID=35722 RepID=A0A0B7N0M4_9FUNG|nr:hypothetical protein [Parasitella parasitica]
MNYLLSPPSSPRSDSAPSFQDHVTCGTCDEILGADWFCSNCHVKCNSCNRFLNQNEYCSRCWSFDPIHQQFLRKNFTSSFINYYQSAPPRQPDAAMLTALPSPSNSTGSENNIHSNKVTRNHRSL